MTTDEEMGKVIFSIRPTSMLRMQSRTMKVKP